ncbi:MAG: hypothetical protein ACE5E9_01165 [Nitrospinaceae bacterium]
MAGFIWMLTWMGTASAGEHLLQVVAGGRADAAGSVSVWLTLKNAGNRPIFNIHPRLQFHHTQSMMSRIVKLEPGQSITLENTEHPPVLRVGRYPLVARVSYRKSPTDAVPLSLIHTGSFYFQEPVESVIQGRIDSSVEPRGALLRVRLINNSTALKNVRMMLLLPPGLIAKSFRGMMGVTLRGGEQKNFTVPVQKSADSREGGYPVHLMIEYAEMVKHYTGEIRGRIHFGTVWDSGAYGPHLAVIAAMSLALFLAYRWKARRSLQT